MKKFAAVIGLFLLPGIIPVLPQQHEVSVRNVAVPFRALDGGTFISDLKVGDLELLDDGVTQKIAALYLISDGKIQNRETRVDYMPLLSQSYLFIFQIFEYSPEIEKSLAHFITNIYRTDDSLVIVTPFKSYSLSKEAVQNKARATIIKDMSAVIRRDTNIAAKEYNGILSSLKQATRSISSSGHANTQSIEGNSAAGMMGLGDSLRNYRESLIKMDSLRLIREDRLIQFAQSLKRMGGLKNVYFFYQREYRPEISPSILQQLIDANSEDPNTTGLLMELFQFYNRAGGYNSAKIKEAFADSFINFNFLFMDSKAKNTFGLYMREQSEDAFEVLSQVAEATGGIVDTSRNPFSAFVNSAESSGTYYLLYYCPKSYKSDRKFHTITLRTKSGDLEIIHRMGYVAD